MINKLSRTGQIFLILIITTILDQITKIVARAVLPYNVEYNYFYDIFTIRYVENKGAFLSLGADLPDTYRFLIFSVFVTIGLLYILWTVIKDKNMDKFQTNMMSLIIGGGIGNLIDRIFRGSVTDFFNMGIGNLRTGIFNVADMFVTFGAIFLMLKMGWEKYSQKSDNITKM